MRTLYTLLWCFALPLLPLRLWWRGRREPGYRARIGERFGRYAADVPRPRGEVVWIHAVSLGETRAAEPLVRRIARARPQATILLTSMTATGREAGRALDGGRVIQAWLPYDVPFAVDAFLDRFAPRAGLLMETELWPNLVHACRARGVPIRLVNARMSAKSAAGYRKFAALTRPMLEALAGIAAQTPSDAQRLEALGARDVTVTGSLKFDMAVPDAMVERGAALRTRFGRGRPVWLAASTRDGEEALLLDAMAHGALPADALLLLVPRHPQRFDAVFALVEARGLACVRRIERRAGRRQRPASCSATRWARCSPTARPRTWRSSAAACCRSAGRTCSSRSPSACRRWSARTRSISPRRPSARSKRAPRVASPTRRR